MNVTTAEDGILYFSQKAIFSIDRVKIKFPLKKMILFADMFAKFWPTPPTLLAYKVEKKDFFYINPL